MAAIAADSSAATAARIKNDMRSSRDVHSASVVRRHIGWMDQRSARVRPQWAGGRATDASGEERPRRPLGTVGEEGSHARRRERRDEFVIRRVVNTDNGSRQGCSGTARCAGAARGVLEGLCLDGDGLGGSRTRTVVAVRAQRYDAVMVTWLRRLASRVAVIVSRMGAVMSRTAVEHRCGGEALCRNCKGQQPHQRDPQEAPHGKSLIHP